LFNEAKFDIRFQGKVEDSSSPSPNWIWCQIILLWNTYRALFSRDEQPGMRRKSAKVMDSDWGLFLQCYSAVLEGGGSFEGSSVCPADFNNFHVILITGINVIFEVFTAVTMKNVVLGSSAVWLMSEPTFRRNIASQSSGWKDSVNYEQC
jgi:hypothetical protein